MDVGTELPRKRSNRAYGYLVIYKDTFLKKELLQLLDFHFYDTVKARWIGEQGQNQPIESADQSKLRAQRAMYDWIKEHN